MTDSPDLLLKAEHAALTGSTFASGVSLAAETLPGILLSPIAGVFADRWDRRRTMIATSVVRAFVVASLLLTRDPGDIWIIYIALLVESGAGQFFNPARTALVPGLVGRGAALVAANSLSAMANATVRLVGSVAGGALYAVTGFHVVVAVDVASYVVAAVLIALIRPKEAGASTVGSAADATGPCASSPQRSPRDGGTYGTGRRCAWYSPSVCCSASAQER
jgi:MFS family permease